MNISANILTQEVYLMLLKNFQKDQQCQSEKKGIRDYLGDKSTPPSICFLTFCFFILNFLAATQDIAVDGWALTMLSKDNVGWASTCNSVGQTAGYFLGNVLFLALESPTFCNKYLRSVPSSEGIITLADRFCCL
ncbi:acetyl-coenzyme A transporter 1-like [Octopus vulgaris]|uniref:Acetyl-coenzyme A transporter 1-like n=1 Tax=Octopus vulgaris TaxID=6645 RepID=A0AA36BK21_OCTVU|nr:acetyl-coenzyme A transporter 1-like [Octopus vulgaris]